MGFRGYCAPRGTGGGAGGGRERRRDGERRRRCYGTYGNGGKASLHANGCTHEYQGGSGSATRGPGASENTGGEPAAEKGGGGAKPPEQGRRGYGYAYGQLALD